MSEHRKLTRPMWIRVKGEHHRGMLVEGRVFRQLPDGYLLQLGRGRRLVHGFLSHADVQQMGHGTGTTFTIREGDLLSAYVEDYDDTRMHLRLSLRQGAPRVLDQFVESIQLGTKLVGRVVDHGAAGVFVRLENGFDALLPTSEVPKTTGQPIEEILRLGDQVAGVVITKDAARRRIHLSVAKYLDGSAHPEWIEPSTHVNETETLAGPTADAFMDNTPIASVSRHIVVLEDEEDILVGLVTFLLQCGHKVHTASTLDQLFSDLVEHELECIVLDLMVHGEQVLMPVLERVRSKHPSVKIITCSAYYDPDVAAQLVEARDHVIDALLKPVSLERLARRIDSCTAAEQFEVEMFGGHPDAESNLLTARPTTQARARTRKEALDVLFNAVCRQWPRDAVLLVHRPNNSCDCEFLRSEGIDRASFDRERLQLKYSPVNDVMRLGETVAVSNLDGGAATRSQALRRIVKCSAMIGAPVSVMGEPEYGVFVFRASEEPFGADDPKVIERIANESCLPLERIRNLEAVTQDHMRLSTANLMAGVAHETNNSVAAMMLSLQNVKGSISLLEKGELPSADQEKLAKTLRSVTRRGDAITKILRSFLAGMMHSATSLEELYKLVFEMKEWIEPQAELAGIELNCALHSSLAKVKVPQLPLRQSIFNLVLNAVQQLQKVPCGKQKCVTIEGGRDESAKLPIWITVTDNGPGIHEDQRERIFDAYFTTRKEGTGLGLYLTRWCIEALGGRVFVQETVRFEGTCFRIELPDSSKDSRPERKVSKRE